MYEYIVQKVELHIERCSCIQVRVRSTHIKALTHTHMHVHLHARTQVNRTPLPHIHRALSDAACLPPRVELSATVQTALAFSSERPQLVANESGTAAKRGYRTPSQRHKRSCRSSGCGERKCRVIAALGIPSGGGSCGHDRVLAANVSNHSRWLYGRS